MRFRESNPQKRALMQKQAAEMLRKKEAWKKKYEMNLRRAKFDNSALKLEEY
jgi:hypothetical protein